MRRGAQPLSDLVSDLLDPVIERRAGMTMDLLGSWTEIAGEDHARQSRPEKLLWPRRATQEDPFEPATLVVACESGHALFLQHDSSTIVDRINDYFGFAAVVRLKLVQKPVPNADLPRKLRSGERLSRVPADVGRLLREIDDPDLKRSLENLGRGVFRESTSDEK